MVNAQPHVLLRSGTGGSPCGEAGLAVVSVEQLNLPPQAMSTGGMSHSPRAGPSGPGWAMEASECVPPDHQCRFPSSAQTARAPSTALLVLCWHCHCRPIVATSCWGNKKAAAVCVVRSLYRGPHWVYFMCCLIPVFQTNPAGKLIAYLCYEKRNGHSGIKYVTVV